MGFRKHEMSFRGVNFHIIEEIFILCMSILHDEP